MVHNFGLGYEKTLLCWNARFQKHVKSGAIQRPQESYLLYCTAGFWTRVTQLSQVVFTKKRAERYDTVRRVRYENRKTAHKLSKRWQVNENGKQLATNFARQQERRY